MVPDDTLDRHTLEQVGRRMVLELLVARGSGRPWSANLGLAGAGLAALLYLSSRTGRGG